MGCVSRHAVGARSRASSSRGVPDTLAFWSKRHGGGEGAAGNHRNGLIVARAKVGDHFAWISGDLGDERDTRSVRDWGRDEHLGRVVACQGHRINPLWSDGSLGVFAQSAAEM